MKRTEIYLQKQNRKKRRKSQHTPFNFVEKGMKNIIVWCMPTWFCLCTKRRQRSLNETRAMYFICGKGKDSLRTSAINIAVLYVTFTWVTVQCFRFIERQNHNKNGLNFFLFSKIGAGYDEFWYFLWCYPEEVAIWGRMTHIYVI